MLSAFMLSAFMLCLHAVPLCCAFMLSVIMLNVMAVRSIKKEFFVQNKLSLLLKIILYNTWTLQLFTINKAY